MCDGRHLSGKQGLQVAGAGVVPLAWLERRLRNKRLLARCHPCLRRLRTRSLRRLPCRRRPSQPRASQGRVGNKAKDRCRLRSNRELAGEGRGDVRYVGAGISWRLRGGPHTLQDAQYPSSGARHLRRSTSVALPRNLEQAEAGVPRESPWPMIAERPSRLTIAANGACCNG